MTVVVIVPKWRKSPKEKKPVDNTVNYVVLSAAEAKPLAEAVINKILNIRDNQEKRVLDNVIETEAKKFWNRFWKKPRLTHEEAMDLLNTRSAQGDGYYHPMDAVWNLYEKEIHAARKVLTALKYKTELAIEVDSLDRFHYFAERHP